MGILEVILIVLLVILFILGIILFFTEDDFLVLFLAFFLSALFFCAYKEKEKMENPPKTIEENGYIYQLEDYEVEQTIERYGKTYVLVTE